MAEIQVERTRKSSAAGWAAILIVLVALLGAGWYFTLGPGATTQTDIVPAAQTEMPSPAPQVTPATPPVSAGGAEGAPAPPAHP